MTFDNGHGSSVQCIAFSPDNNCISSGGFDDGLILWSVRDKKMI